MEKSEDIHIAIKNDKDRKKESSCDYTDFKHQKIIIEQTHFNFCSLNIHM